MVSFITHSTDSRIRCRIALQNEGEDRWNFRYYAAQSDHLTLGYSLPATDVDRGQVAVKGLITVSVINHNHNTVPASDLSPAYTTVPLSVA